MIYPDDIPLKENSEASLCLDDNQSTKKVRIRKWPIKPPLEGDEKAEQMADMNMDEGNKMDLTAYEEDCQVDTAPNRVGQFQAWGRDEVSFRDKLTNTKAQE